MHTEKKKNEKKNVKDDFYDRINYYESRNIFSTNEAFDPGNRLYTDQASLTHGVWDKINKTSYRSQEEEIHDKRPIQNVDSALAKSEFTQNLLSSITKLSGISNNAPIGCSKCGFVGHLPYMCRNNFKIKNKGTVNENADQSGEYKEKDSEMIEDKKRIDAEKNGKLNSKLSELHKKEIELLVSRELEKLNKDKKDKKSKKHKKEKKSKKDKKEKKEKKEKDSEKRSRSLSSNSRSSEPYSRSRSRSLSRDKSKNKNKHRDYK